MVSTTTQSTKKRLENIDLLKFITLAWITVPTFLLINGYLIINKKFNIRQHIKKILHIIAMIFIWGGITIVLLKLITQETLDLKSITQLVFLPKQGNPYTNPLWFLEFLTAVYIIYPILKYVYDANIKIYYYIFAVVVFFAFGDNILQFLAFLFGSHPFISSLFQNIAASIRQFNPFGFDCTIYLLYFMAGTCLNKISVSKKFAHLTLLIGIISHVTLFTIVSMLNSYEIINTGIGNLNSLSMFIIVVSLYYASIDFQTKHRFSNKIIRTIGDNTMGIYLIHPIIAILIKTTLVSAYPSFFDNIFTNLLFVSIILVISLCVTLIIRKIPIAKNYVKI